MITKICKTCNKEFKVINSRKDKAKYCSRSCSGKDSRAKPNVRCVICGKNFHRKQSQLKKLKTKPTCSVKCRAKLQQTTLKGDKNHQYGLKGHLNASFKGLELERKNHNTIDVMVYKPEHPYANEGGRVLKHRLIVEENYKMFDSKHFDFINGQFFLKKGLDVHHIDFNHSNNSIDNLQVLTKAEHTALHNKFKTIVREKTNGRIIKVIKNMDLKDYQKNAKRTCASLGDERLDLSHMVLGIISEQEEYLKALVEDDEVNQREELADMCWYIANYCEIRGYNFYEILKDNENYFEPKEDWAKEVSCFSVYTSKLADYVKKYVAYGKEINRDKEKEALGAILYSITLEECYFNFERDLTLNIEKLKQRFPEKFTTEKALNRNLKKEREILES